MNKKRVNAQPHSALIICGIAMALSFGMAHGKTPATADCTPATHTTCPKEGADTTLKKKNRHRHATRRTDQTSEELFFARAVSTPPVKPAKH